MPDIEINDLAGIGLIRDQEGHQLPPEAFSYAYNMRFSDQGVERIGGRTQVFGTPPVAPHFMIPVQSTSQTFWLYTSLTKAYVYDGVTHTNITRQTASVDVNYSATATREWNGVLLGGVAILNNGTDDPQYWPSLSTAVKLTMLLNWPANTKCKVMRSIGPFLVALDVAKSGTRYPHMVKWSHPADPGTIPISWDEADPTTDAGEIDLPDVNAGTIQDGLPLRGQLFIYKAGSVWRMRFIGGQDIFNFDTLLESAGALGPRCITITSDGQKHVFASQDDIIIHNGTSAESILDKRMKRTLVNVIDPTTYVNSFMFTDPHRDECWFCYPEIGQTNPNRAIIFNSRTGILSEADVNFRNSATGIIETPSADIWSTISTTWDTVTVPWGLQSRRQEVLCGTDAGKFFELDAGTTFDGANFLGTLQRVGLSLVGRKRSGEWIVDFAKHKFVRRVWIKGSGGPFDVRVGFQRLPEGDVTWSPVKTFNPAAQRWINVAGSGKAVAIEFSAVVPFRIAGYKLESDPLGRF